MKKKKLQYYCYTQVNQVQVYSVLRFNYLTTCSARAMLAPIPRCWIDRTGCGFYLCIKMKVDQMAPWQG